MSKTEQIINTSISKNRYQNIYIYIHVYKFYNILILRVL